MLGSTLAEHRDTAEFVLVRDTVSIPHYRRRCYAVSCLPYRSQPWECFLQSVWCATFGGTGFHRRGLATASIYVSAASLLLGSAGICCGTSSGDKLGAFR